MVATIAAVETLAGAEGGGVEPLWPATLPCGGALKVESIDLSRVKAKGIS